MMEIAEKEINDMSGTKVKRGLAVLAVVVILWLSFYLFTNTFTVYLPGGIIYENEGEDGGRVAEHITILPKQ